MKIYLAGNYNTDWRTKFVDSKILENPRFTRYNALENKWEIISDIENAQGWAVSDNAVLGGLDFVGPYKHTGDVGHGMFVKKAIQEADVVFAWVENLENFAEIIVELGYASGAGKFVYICEPNDSRFSNSYEFSYAFRVCDFWPFGHEYNDPIDGFKDCLDSLYPFFDLDLKFTLKQFSRKKKDYPIQLSKKLGYIYIIKAETGHYKIGRSMNVPQRMKLFAVKLPFKFEILHTFPADNMYRAEKLLHRHFDYCRTNGEWFKLKEEEVALILSIKKYTQDYSFMSNDGSLGLGEEKQK